MKKTFLIFPALILISAIFLMSFTGAITLCIDHIPPSAPSNLILTNSGLNVQLKWTAATDEPSCSGISHYEVFRGFNNGVLSLINNFTVPTDYLDSVSTYGKYTYLIHAWDLAGHNEGQGASNSITLSTGGNSGGGGGGGGSSFTTIFKCGSWTKCIQETSSSLRGTQTRICQDVRGIQANKTESKSCIPNFVPTSSNNLNETQNGNQINLTNSSTNETTTPSQKTTGFLTGAAIGAGNLLKSNKLAFAFLIILLLLGIFLILKKRKHKKKRPKKKK